VIRPLPVNPQTIPQEMKSFPQWVAWKSVLDKGRPGKIKKLPIDPKSSKTASSIDPTTWAHFDEAYAYYLQHRNNGIGGISFALAKDDCYVGVDLDHCRNPATGNIEPWAMDIISELNSYTELSPSGEGIRIFVKAKLDLDQSGIKRGKIELYDHKRFMTVTGQVKYGIEHDN
jgi:primase-polymerase (primpol)-like protein